MFFSFPYIFLWSSCRSSSPFKPDVWSSPVNAVSAALLQAVTSGLKAGLFSHGFFFSLLLWKNPFRAAFPPKQMTVQRGSQPFAWHKVRANDCESAKNQDGLSAKEPAGKKWKSCHIWKGNELGCEAARRKHWKPCMFLQHFLVTDSLWGKGILSFTPSSQSLCSPLPSCQQRCAIVTERPISIIRLMNTKWPQVVLIKKVQRLQTVICNLSPWREGFLGKQARGGGKIRPIRTICFILNDRARLLLLKAVKFSHFIPDRSEI